MDGKVTDYAISMRYERWNDPNNIINGVQVGDNWTSTAYLHANNTHSKYKAAYIPITLSAEFDVMPLLTIGVAGYYKAILTSNKLAPNGLLATCITARYKIPCMKTGVLSLTQQFRSLITE